MAEAVAEEIKEAAPTNEASADGPATNSSPERLYFPSDLAKRVDDGAPYMRIKINERVGSDFVTPFIIGLYIPSNVSVTDTINYGMFEKGMYGAGFDVGMAALTGKLPEGVTEADIAAGGLKYGLGALSGFNIPIIDQLGKGTQLGMIELGVAVNPNEITKFDGTSRRSFNFTFKFMSESAEEAQTAQKIIDAIRTYSYPEVLGSVSLQYPAEFEIAFYKNEEQNPFMPIIMPCVCESVGVTINPTGNSFHADGSPVEIDLTIGLKEKAALTRNDLNGDFVGKDDQKSAIESATEKGKAIAALANGGTSTTSGGPQ